MTFKEYAEQATQFALYPKEHGLSYTALGLTGEAGEYADKVKKVLRDAGGTITGEAALALMAELGDVLWYAQEAARVLGFSLEWAARHNLQKLTSRAERGVLQGSGDKR